MTVRHPREYDVVVERDGEGYYVASVPALPGCHTQARSLDELMERVKEAIELCLEVEGDTGDGLDFVGVQRIRLATAIRHHGMPRGTIAGATTNHDQSIIVAPAAGSRCPRLL